MLEMKAARRWPTRRPEVSPWGLVTGESGCEKHITTGTEERTLPGVPRECGALAALRGLLGGTQGCSGLRPRGAVWSLQMKRRVLGLSRRSPFNQDVTAMSSKSVSGGRGRGRAPGSRGDAGLRGPEAYQLELRTRLRVSLRSATAAWEKPISVLGTWGVGAAVERVSGTELGVNS